VSLSKRAPVRVATRLAVRRAGSRSARPFSRSAHGSPPRSTFATASTTEPGTLRASAGAARGDAPDAGLQATSAGRTSVATRPGGSIDAPTAAATSPASVSTEEMARVHSEAPRAIDSISE
jgi:hypothetical protein